ncbi:MAG: YihY/virulence factor BrkB family protein [Paracoccaceae bacterium]
MIPMSTFRAAGFALLRLAQRTDRAELGMMAASVAFFGFLAIFPAVAAVIAIWGFAADPGIIRQEVALLRDVLPSDAYSLLSTQIEALLTANSSHLGWATLFSTLFALWSARAGVDALIRGLNAIHHFPNRAGLPHLGLAVVLTLTLVGITLAALLAAVVAPLIIGLLPVGSASALALEMANTGLGLLIVVFGIGLAYRFGPNRPPAAPRPALFTPGLVLAVVLWALVSRGLVIYLANFGSYNQIYGSIGAVAALLMWLYLSAYAVLLGAAVDAEREMPVSNPSP